MNPFPKFFIALILISTSAFSSYDVKKVCTGTVVFSSNASTLFSENAYIQDVKLEIFMARSDKGKNRGKLEPVETKLTFKGDMRLFETYDDEFKGADKIRLADHVSYDYKICFGPHLTRHRVN